MADRYLVIVRFKDIIKEYNEVADLKKKGFNLRHLGGGSYEGFVSEEEYDRLDKKYGCNLKGIFK